MTPGSSVTLQNEMTAGINCRSVTDSRKTESYNSSDKEAVSCVHHYLQYQHMFSTFEIYL